MLTFCVSMGNEHKSADSKFSTMYIKTLWKDSPLSCWIAMRFVNFKRQTKYNNSKPIFTLHTFVYSFTSRNRTRDNFRWFWQRIEFIGTVWCGHILYDALYIPQYYTYNSRGGLVALCVFHVLHEMNSVHCIHTILI